MRAAAAHVMDRLRLAPAGKSGRRFGRDRRATAAMEFALTMPVMVTMLLCAVDATRALIAWRAVTSTAQSAAEITTALAAQANDGTYQLTVAQGYAAATAIYAVIPSLKNGATNTFSVTLSAIAFATVTATCTANSACVAWSVVAAYSPDQLTGTLRNLRRPCTTPQTQVSSTGYVPSVTTLPTLGATGLTSLIVADVKYVFRPMFVSLFTGPITMWRTAYLPTRVGGAAAYIEYDVANASTNTNVCAGFL